MGGEFRAARHELWSCSVDLESVPETILRCNVVGIVGQSCVRQVPGTDQRYGRETGSGDERQSESSFWKPEDDGKCREKHGRSVQ